MLQLEEVPAKEYCGESHICSHIVSYIEETSQMEQKSHVAPLPIPLC